MSLWSKLKALFASPSDVKWLTANGQRQHWLPGDRVTVIVDEANIEPGSSAVALALQEIRKIRAAGVKLLLLPTAGLERDMRVLFEQSRDTITHVVLIRAYRVHPGALQSSTSSTDYRFDRRDGLMRNAVITWDMVGNDVVDARNLTHELGHIMGLAHEPGTVMAACNTRDGSGPTWFSPEQLKSLLNAYPW